MNRSRTKRRSSSRVAASGTRQNVRRSVQRDFFAYVPVGLFRTARNGEIKEANPALARMFGYSSAKALIGRNVLDLYADPDDRRRVIAILEHEGDVQDFKAMFRRLDGTLIWGRFTTRVFGSRGSNLRYFRGAIEDITAREHAEEAARQHRERYQRLFAGVPVGIYRTSPEGVFEDVNPALVQMLGYPSAASLRQADVSSLYAEAADRDRLRQLLTDSPPVRDFETVLIRQDGSPIDVTISARSVSGADGRVIAYEGIVEDVTERKRAERVLRESEQRFRQLAETIREVFWLRDATGSRVEYVSPAYEEIWGRTRAGLFADPESWLAPVLEEDRDRMRQTVEQQNREGMPSESEYRIVRPDGSTRWIWDRAFPVRDEAGRVVRFAGIAEDVTERKRSEEQNARLLSELRTLSHKLVLAQETERRHIAAELHDEVAQLLTGLRFLIESEPESASGADRGRRARATRLMDEVMSRIRNLSLDLRPETLDHLGLLPALLGHLRRFTEQTGVEVDFAHSSIDRRFSPDIETAAFRIAQEALTNVARHAGTGRAYLTVSLNNGVLSVKTEDRGMGFDPECARAEQRGAGLGGMRERVAALGGTLTIDTARGAGVRVLADLPLDARDPA